MEELEILFGLLLVMLGLVAVARRIGIAYPILLVLAGLVIGFIPGLPKIEVKPEIVFIVFLPPILQMAAYSTPMRDFRANLRSIGLLAIGLVLATSAIVAIVAHYIIGLTWAEGFLLGAIVAPPDAIAATSVAQNVKMPKRIVTILEGESLLNDASSLVIYRVALAAVVSGTFSLFDAGLQFLISSIAGLAIGLVIGVVLTPVFRWLVNDAPVFVILTFLSGYGAYLLAEAFHVSGVLAVVALGLFYVRHNTMNAELRLQATPVWQIVVFLINGLVFILIGLQLGHIVGTLDGQSPLVLIGYGAVVSLAVIIVRLLWVFPGAYLSNLAGGNNKKGAYPAWQNVLVTGWAGMRGIVSLAAALALPLTINNGPFHNRDLIIYLTFAVILATLVLQGLSLPLLVRNLKLQDDSNEEREEHKARLKAAHAARERLTELAEEDWVTTKVVDKLRMQYEARIRHFTALYQGEDADHETEQNLQSYRRMRQELIQAERDAILMLRDSGIINDEVMRRVQYELDLEIVQITN